MLPPLLTALLLLSPAVPRDRNVVVVSLDGFPAYALQDEQLPAPTLRRLMREGASAREMYTVNPTVTWPNHTSMVTGVTPARHGVLYNGLPIRENGRVRVEPWVLKRELVQAPTVYDLAHANGLTTAEVDWVAVTKPGTITWSFGERPDPNGQIEREMAKAGLISETQLRDFGKSNPAWRDQMWTEAAVLILERHKPNLLLFHLLNLDSVSHRYGPGTAAWYTAISLLDSQLQKILDALGRAGTLRQTTILVVSDHGFKVARRLIHPNAVAPEAFAIPEGGTAMVYLKEPKELDQVKARFEGVEGIDRALTARDFAALGLPTPQATRRMPELVLVAKGGYAFASGNSSPAVTEIPPGDAPGNHGYLASDPEMNALFVAWGRGIRRGVRVDAVRTVDVGPTVAALLRLTLEPADGRPLDSILEK